jgi:N utilization substance protein A
MQPDSDSTAVIQKLLEHHVPEIGSGAVEVRGIAREPGKRTMIAVESNVSSVDAVGSCAGVRGTRVRAMLAELPGEHMDIVLWNSELQRFLGNLLAPNRTIQVSLDQSTRRATVNVPPDWTPLSELRLRLASKLVGWDLKIVTSEM